MRHSGYCYCKSRQKLYEDRLLLQIVSCGVKKRKLSNLPLTCFRFAELQEVKCTAAGRMLFLRFKASTGDAMGMNMVSKVTA